MRHVSEDAPARSAAPPGGILADLGLGVVALGISGGVFLLSGAIAISLLALAAQALGLLAWRQRRAHLATAILALASGVLLLSGGGPTVCGFGLGPLLGALAILSVFWPLVGALAGR